MDIKCQGEVESLYKTTKPCHYLMHSHDTFMIDLHGLTVDEAMNTLNEALPERVNAAMKQEATVKIVCGCGNHDHLYVLTCPGIQTDIHHC